MAKDPWDDTYEPDYIRRDQYILRKLQEIEREKARQSFQQKPVQWLDPRMPPEHDPLSDLRKIQQTQRKTSYTIPPPPAEYLVTFIGGPFNATQRTILRKDIPLDNGQTFRAPGESITRYHTDKEPEHIFETFDYRLTFIPTNETTFTDAQCVVAVFTGKGTPMKALTIIPLPEGYAFIETEAPESVRIQDFVQFVENSYSFKVTDAVSSWITRQKEKAPVALPPSETP